MSVDTLGSTALDWREERSTTKPKSSIWQMMLQEARVVSAWFVVSSFLRALVEELIGLASYQTDCNENQCESVLPKTFLRTASVISRWVLQAFPSKLASGAAPGFIYASPWILIATKNVFGSLPNVPLRIAEGVIGRLSLKQLAILMPLHFACATYTSFVLRYLISRHYSLIIDPIEYTEVKSLPMDFLREALPTTIFCVAFLIIPELFAVNHLPRWLFVPLMYPIYNTSVDAVTGKASTFGPDVLYALAVSSPSGTYLSLGQSTGRLLGSLFGGFFGGLIVQQFFPDDN